MSKKTEKLAVFEQKMEAEKEAARSEMPAEWKELLGSKKYMAGNKRNQKDLRRRFSQKLSSTAWKELAEETARELQAAELKISHLEAVAALEGENNLMRLSTRRLMSRWLRTSATNSAAWRCPSSGDHLGGSG